MDKEHALPFSSAPKLVLVLSKLSDERKRLTLAFGASGYCVFEASSVTEAEQILASREVDLVVVEAYRLVDAPFDFWTNACDRRQPPLIFVTESEGVFDEVIALEVGADAFIQKPVDTRLLLAKSKALLRRRASQSAPAKAPHRDIRSSWMLNSAFLTAVSPSGLEIELSPAQFKLFNIFIENPNKVHTQDSLSTLLGGDLSKVKTRYDVHVASTAKNRNNSG